MATRAGRRNGTASTRLATLIRLVRAAIQVIGPVAPTRWLTGPQERAWRRYRRLVARQPCADDARGALISLTEQGQAVLQQAAPPHVASVRQHLMDLLTPEEVTALDQIATKVIAELTPGSP